MASYTTPYHTIGSNFNYELETHHDQLQWYKIRGFSVTNVKNDSLQIKNTNKLHNFIMTYFKIFYEEWLTFYDNMSFIKALTSII